MAIELNIDKTKIDPIVGEIKEKYIQHIIAAAVLALILWFITPNRYGNYNGMMANFDVVLIFLLITMVISYMILVIGSSDSLMAALKETGYFDLLNGKLTIATVLSILGYVLIVMVSTYFSWVANNFWPINEAMTSHEIMFILIMFVVSLALVFFVSVVMTLMKISELRVA